MREKSKFSSLDDSKYKEKELREYFYKFNRIKDYVKSVK